MASQVLSWTSSMRPSSFVPLVGYERDSRNQASFSVHAAWTRRSKGPDSPTKKKSWGQRADKYMKPFMLDVYISKRYVNCKVTHRVTSKVVAVATTSSRELRESLRSLCDENACKVIAKLIAERSMEADVYCVKFQLRTNEKFEGKLALVVNSVAEEGLTVMV
eukprot:TRINITY_DN26322_c0_g1_i1.p1 TRINITY_DN26322_c0_g1~~TRINITY_DN26322_c0_g1_i1.p1  ORF type:complete len:163 (-),score=24.71 TRINITY_DN26322_c0_g1_i1:297-785(-)